MNAQPWSVRALTVETMGMTVSLHVRAEDPHRSDIVEAATEAFRVFGRADRVFSPWKPESDLMRIRRGEMTADEADPWYAEVVQLCRGAEERTNGLFTTDLVGPDDTRGWDPTGLVKGWAGDRAADVLRTLEGVEFCLNAAGDIVVDGRPGDGAEISDTWRIGLADPADSSRIRDVVELRRGALATSGTGERGQHIVDPRTGRPAETPHGSVTVTGPSLLWADVWATVAFIDPAAVRGNDDGCTLVSILR